MFPPNKKFVRANVKYVGYYVIPTNTKEGSESCNIFNIIHVKSVGLPMALVKKAMVAGIPRFAGNFSRALKKFRKASAKDD